MYQISMSSLFPVSRFFINRVMATPLAVTPVTVAVALCTPTMATNKRLVEEATLIDKLAEAAFTDVETALSNTGAPGQENVGESVAVLVTEGVAVYVAVLVDVSVPVVVGVFVGVDVGPGGVKVPVGVSVWVLVTVKVDVMVGVEVGDTVGVTVGPPQDLISTAWSSALPTAEKV